MLPSLQGGVGGGSFSLHGGAGGGSGGSGRSSCCCEALLNCFEGQAHEGERCAYLVDQVDEEPNLRLEVRFLLLRLIFLHAAGVAVAQLVAVAALCPHHGCCHQEGVDDVGQGGAIPGRQDGDVQSGVGVGIGVASLPEQKLIGARWNVGVGGLGILGAPRPVSVDALQHILEALLGHSAHQVGSGKVEREAVVGVG